GRRSDHGDDPCEGNRLRGERHALCDHQRAEGQRGMQTERGEPSNRVGPLRSSGDTHRRTTSRLTCWKPSPRTSSTSETNRSSIVVLSARTTTADSPGSPPRVSFNPSAITCRSFTNKWPSALSVITIGTSLRSPASFALARLTG